MSGLALKLSIRLHAVGVQGAVGKRGLNGAAGFLLVMAVGKSAERGQIQDVRKGCVQPGIGSGHAQ